jgi:LPXTG-motif cell wall-anchored protein
MPAQAGFTTGGLLAIAAAIGVGGWLLFGRKKKQPASAAA